MSLPRNPQFGPIETATEAHQRAMDALTDQAIDKLLGLWVVRLEDAIEHRKKRRTKESLISPKDAVVLLELTRRRAEFLPSRDRIIRVVDEAIAAEAGQ